MIIKFCAIVAVDRIMSADYQLAVSDDIDMHIPLAVVVQSVASVHNTYKGERIWIAR